MKYSRGIAEIHMEEATAVSLGKFDGLHKGHQLLLSRILQKKEEGLTSVMFTFDFGREEELMLNTERRKMLEAWGVDHLVECPFGPEISAMEPEAFVHDVLKKQLRAAYIAVGTDFRFGYQRRGDWKLLQALGSECGYTVEVVEKARYQGRDISSTYIKEELQMGNMELVNELLGYPYSVTGRIVHGRAMGRGMGIPTINVQPAAGKMLPHNGVYASRSCIDGHIYEGITNVGYKPTVGGEQVKGTETYLFDVNQDLYEKEATVSFYAFRRPEQKFASLDELKQQMNKDIEWGRNWFRNL